MNRVNNTLATILQAIAVMGILVGFLFVFQFVKTHLLPSNENSEDSLAAYPAPGSTQVLTPIPASTLFPTQTPTPTPIVLENGWYLYTDSDKEFSFAYPPGSVITAGQNPVDLSKNINIQFNLPDKPYQGMSIRVELNPNRLPSADFAVKLFDESSQQQAPAQFVNSLKPISIGGMAAVQAFIPSTNTEVTIIASYGDRVLFLAPVHDSAEIAVEKESLELFYQILDTFKSTAPR